ncbi:CcoQ/FixQ family Cbb3-type cytochrome c oxidase assembly chaperone [bacterium (Candidatus Blackallbacteria) CG17_big_fil_post_rev_8_21_14_2_50_48_46]|uniref:CcoQ/FixQ family Cbb3-type cytochrome c oxidase assembly chaperone n=1 Tax=bacterium (Candidatus Blackallbacteria) CG17_big_fil_post_rev_8_21_14_2_50_48_46 TaxID=2014261 RepID=A0A2M7G9S4_9BACT|nr:MAG: CcoQ/FixQ family Cbb3-type cytochrome c oxidase assembly chaperone [bacterium (Candidatus Blackallbacteria) CG18_big_fil_WC_8_21_14_2_50_49_26]PIW18805.1 MAG: CcoQ/FixQ family Cbb3-type cytochrome c oxidase assembly chaperone [bacterium (Candidatus Blackallbacteria) CG17_big_fil_post_rev_8_21_14_2_50_48_46]PIW49260.1 MAG: CcoQ/FixQ family Cbb3-type cytochrome c oxidase assembly chaperone [bacterium (Candidatus Blackallbacteria) CG13_big_fil_rev_8_21_14_2_50_49_14]
MKSEVLAYFNMPDLTNVGLIIFFTVFISMLIWVFQPWRKPVYQHMSELPLQEDT